MPSKTKATKPAKKQPTDAEKLQAIGASAFKCIEDMVQRLNSEEERTSEQAREEIEQDALSVEVRGDWHSPGDRDHEADGPAEYRILLSTGGPATRIVGELVRGEPSTARLEAQDWFQPWTEYQGADESVLLAYAAVFYWGEG